MTNRAFFRRSLFAVLLTNVFAFAASGQSADDPRQFIGLYLDALSSSQWEELVRPFMPTREVADDFVAQHRPFRKAFAGYRASLKHLVVDGNRAVAWLRISARHVGVFPYDEFAGAKPDGKTISWEEVWYFDVENGKFGGEWDFLVNGVARMKELGIRCLPD